MKLLFDQNLSHKLVNRLADLFPDSSHKRLLGMNTAQDIVIWNYAKTHDYTVVTLDADFYDLSTLLGHPPKLIWLRCGNLPIREIERLLRLNLQQIRVFASDEITGCLEVF